MKHKKQHYIPRSYLKMWCDKATPKGYEPYLWLFSKDGKTKKKKAPENIFYENEMYTIYDKENNRSLKLEHGLQSIEDMFCRVRDKKILKRKQIDNNSKFILCLFIAAMNARTVAQRDFQKNQWEEVYDLGERIKREYDNATPAQKEAMIASSKVSGNGPSFSHEEVKELSEKPMQNLLIPQIESLAPLLYKLDMIIFYTCSKPGFITSDTPCMWADPEAYKRPPFYRTPALAYKSTEIRFPVSPNHFILLNRQNVNGYKLLLHRGTNKLNRETRFMCNKSFIVNCDYNDDYWFYKGKEPEDSWEKLNQKP